MLKNIKIHKYFQLIRNNFFTNKYKIQLNKYQINQQ